MILKLDATDEQMRLLSERAGLVQRRCETCSRPLLAFSRSAEGEWKCKECGGMYTIDRKLS